MIIFTFSPPSWEKEEEKDKKKEDKIERGENVET